MSKHNHPRMSELRDRFDSKYGEGRWQSSNTKSQKESDTTRRDWQSNEGKLRLTLMKCGLDLGFSVVSIAGVFGLTNHQVQTNVASYKL